MRPSKHPDHQELGAPDSHELGSVPFSHPDRQPNPLSPRDHNAFGDDSDSDDQEHHRTESDHELDREPDEFDVYKGPSYSLSLPSPSKQATPSKS